MIDQRALSWLNRIDPGSDIGPLFVACETKNGAVPTFLRVKPDGR